jgi:hypothetical protein
MLVRLFYFDTFYLVNFNYIVSKTFHFLSLIFLFSPPSQVVAVERCDPERCEACPERQAAMRRCQCLGSPTETVSDYDV